MIPGFTMAEATLKSKKIAMRRDRIAHINMEIERLTDCREIIEQEIKELE